MLSSYSPQREARNNFARHAHVKSQLILGEHPSLPVTVSIVIPTFRRSLLLAQALDSALAQLNAPSHEIIVVDNDAETDAATEQVVRCRLKGNLRYYRNEQNLGMIGNWNRALELANGPWVSILHDDDWLSPHFLSRMFGSKPGNCAMIASGVVTGTADYRPEVLEGMGVKCGKLTEVTPTRLILGSISPAPGVIMDRACAIALGGFDPDYYPCADYDFYIRMAVHHRAYWLSDVLAYYRTTDSTTNKADTLERIVKDSAAIKSGLLRSTPSITGAVFWLESMKGWYQKAREKNIHGRNRAERLAKWVSENEQMSRVSWYLMRVFHRLDRAFE